MLIDFSSRQGEVEDILKDISERAGHKGNFNYSRFFAIGLFRLLELANATEPTVLEKVDSLTSHFIEEFTSVEIKLESLPLLSDFTQLYLFTIYPRRKHKT